MKRWHKGAALLLFASLVSCSAPTPPDPTPETTYGFAALPTGQPAPDWLTDCWRLEYEEPEKLYLDIAIPQVRKDIPAAPELNQRIRSDYAYFIDRPAEDYAQGCQVFGDPLIRIRYGLYQWEDLCELCIWGREEDLGGSGPLLWTSVYAWDLQDETILSPEELIAHFDYTPQDVEQAFQDQIVWEEDPETYPWETIKKGWFYISEEKELTFTVSLYA